MVNREKLERIVYSIFTDSLMIFLAVLVIPLILVSFVNLNETQEAIIVGIDWFIYGMFLLEFALKVALAKNKFAYIKENRMDSIISLVIIISPAFELIAIYFAAAPLLRLLRISRLVRLGGVVGKTGKDWKRVELKSYIVVIIITSLGIILSFFKPNITYTEELGIFISVIGIIYAIIAAFMIVNVWQEYDTLENLLRKETGSLRNVYIFGRHIDSQVADLHLRNRILDYIEIVKEAYWEETRSPDDIDKKIIEIIDSLKHFKSKNGTDETILNNIYEEVRETSNYRIDIDTLVETKTPAILWMLLIILSVIVFLGFYMVAFEQIIATMTITMVAAATSVVVIIIYDIDYPFSSGFWQISPEPYEQLEKFLKGTQSPTDGSAISETVSTPKSAKKDDI